MAYVKIQDSTLKDIADETRAKLKSEQQYKPSEIPNAIKAIDVSENVYVGSSLDSAFIGEPEYGTAVVIPNSVETIRQYAFHGCEGITHLNTMNVKEIGFGAFYKCSNLSNLTANNVEVIGKNAFARTGLSGAIYLPKARVLESTSFYTTEENAITAVYFGHSEGEVRIDSSAFNGTPEFIYDYWGGYV